jgi:hypothetical protein
MRSLAHMANERAVLFEFDSEEAKRSCPSLTPRKLVRTDFGEVTTTRKKEGRRWWKMVA